MIFLELFYTFFIIGAVTFGGGYAMLPLIQEQVLAKEWLPHDELINFIAVSESTPGPFAINIATYIGSVKGGEVSPFLAPVGSLCATLGVVLPSFIIILIVAKFLERFRSSTFVSGALTGLKPCVVGLIGTAVLSIGQTVFFADGIALAALLTPQTLISALIFITATIAAFKKVHPIIIICLSAVVGILTGYLI